MTGNIETVVTTLYRLLGQRGFAAMLEYTQQDTREYAGQAVGVICLRGQEAERQVFSPSQSKFYLEADTDIRLRLFGVRGNYPDYDDLMDSAQKLFYAICRDDNLVTVQAKLGEAVPNKELSRLEVDLDLRVRTEYSWGDENV